MPLIKSIGQNIQSVVRAFNILELVYRNRHGLRLGDIASSTGINKSTTRRFLITLCNLGYIEQNSNTKLYRITPRLYQVGHFSIQGVDLIESARPHLDTLSSLSDETINLAILDGTDVYYLDKRDSPFPLRIYVELGGRASIHATALGKALVAFLPENVVKSLVYRTYPLQKYTDNTITSWAELRTELMKVKEEGVAYDNEETFAGLKCIAAPVFQAENVLAAISISIPSTRVNPERFKTLKEIILRETHELTVKLSSS